MPLAPPGARFRADPALFNTPNSAHRVPTNQVLVPPTSQHGGYTTRVSNQEMDMLLAANRAISDTWRVLNKGSGNQEKHLRSTGGDSFKRSALVHERRDHLGMQYEAYDSQRNVRRVDLNLTQHEFKQRLIQLGLHPVTGQPTPGNRRPPTSAP